MLLPSTKYSESLLMPNPIQIKKTQRFRLLAWSDDAQAKTGFGVVSKHILTALYNTGLYDIQHLAINHHGDFVNTTEIPWQRSPAKLLDPGDPHGMKMFLRFVAQNDYDVIMVNNDVYVTEEVTKPLQGLPSLQQILQDKVAHNKKVPKIIYYYPVDCHVLPHAADFIKLADVPVCYTDHGRAETLKTAPEVEGKLLQVPHGVNTDVFKPLPQNIRNQIKKQMLNADPDTCVVINVNRNSTRKQIQYSLLAFKEFHKLVPNSKMYVHTAIQDQGGNLAIAVQDLGLSMKDDIIMPVGYSPANGVPDETLNGFYNMGDMFLATHLGEGWGLSVSESLAAGIPTITPDNTCMPELLGNNEERGYMYPCRDMIWVDDSGYRPKGLISDIVDTMMKCWTNKEETAKKVKAAREWCLTHQWKDIGKKWVEIFARTLATPKAVPTVQPATKIISEII